MQEAEQIDQDPGAGGEPVSPKASKHSPFGTAMRGLTEKELTRPESIQFLLAEIQRLSAEVDELKRFRNDFHEADKARALLEQRLKVSIAKDILFNVNLSIGLALLAVIPAIVATLTTPQLVFIGSAGLVLVASAIVAKVLKT